MSEPLTDMSERIFRGEAERARAGAGGAGYLPKTRLMRTLLLQLIFSSFMTGLVWLVQVVHYPSFPFVPESEYARFAHFHTTRITWVVGPVMLAEALTLALLMFRPEHPLGFKLGAGALLLIIWASTFFLQVPLHELLAGGKDAAVIERLVGTNWIRTIAWTLKSGLVGYELLRHFHTR